MINWSREKQKYEAKYLIKGGRKKLSLKSNRDLRIPLKYDAIIVFLLVMLFYSTMLIPENGSNCVEKLLLF